MTDAVQSAAVTFWPSLVNPKGRPAAIEWGALFLEFTRWRPFAGDREHPGWSAARFEPCERSADNVRGVSALVLDYDGAATLDEAEAAWRGTYGLIHTTRKHTPEAHRCRVILPFAREVSPFEYTAIWRRVFHRLGGKVDPAPKDPSRFWFTPGSPDRETYQHRWLAGDLLVPEKLFTWADPETPNHRNEATGARRPEAVDRASNYIAKMPPAISGSGGHPALWAVALVAVKGFGLSESDALTLIDREYNPRCQPPWRRKELEHKVRDACRATKIPDGYKLDEGRDWKRTPASIPHPDPEAGIYSSEDDGPADEELDPVRVHGVRTMAELLNGVYTRASTEKGAIGAPTGVEIVDRQLGGLRREMVTILGAQTSWGKSSFVVLVAETCLAAGKRILIVSGEDGEQMFGSRFMTRRTGINAVSLRDRDLQPRDFAAMTHAMQEAEAEPMFLNGIGKPAEQLAKAITDVCAKRDLDLVVVDYLQAFGCSKKCQDRRTEVTHIARTFIDAIKSARTAGLVVSQLRRLKDNELGSLNDLKESGDLENMAEHVLIGSVLKARDDETRWRRVIAIEKNKDGPRYPRPFELEFSDVTASFTGHTR